MHLWQFQKKKTKRKEQKYYLKKHENLPKFDRKHESSNLGSSMNSKQRNPETHTKKRNNIINISEDKENSKNSKKEVTYNVQEVLNKMTS